MSRIFSTFMYRNEYFYIYFFKKHRKLIKSISVHFKKQLVIKSFINDILLNDCHYTKWDFCCKLQSQYARNGTLWKYSVMHIWIDIIKYNEEIEISAINFIQLKRRKKNQIEFVRKFSSFNLSVVVFTLCIVYCSFQHHYSFRWLYAMAQRN